MICCKCSEVNRLNGREGQDYAKAHLRQLAVDSENWIVLYECPVTGIFWKEYFPNSGDHGGGAPEFIQISADIAKSEFNWIVGDQASLT